MNSKIGIFTVVLFTTVLLIPASSFPLASAQEYNKKDNYSFENNNEPYYIDKDSKEYYYHYQSKDKKFNKLVQECEECFLQELYYQLSDKQRYFFFDAIEYEFGSLEKLCKLIVSGKISEQELEDILRHILVQVFDKVGYENNDKVNSYSYNEYEDKYSKVYHDYENSYKLIPSQKIDKIIYAIIECIFPPNVVITWNEAPFEGSFAEIFAAMSMDKGSTFGTPINVSNTIPFSFNPEIAMSGDNVVITWRELTSGGSEIFASMSMDGGTTFEIPINVSNTVTPSSPPKIAMSGDNVVIIWVEVFPGNHQEIFAAMSSDGGSTFGPPINVSNTDTNSNFQQIAMSGDNVVITWTEVLPGSNSETFAAMSSDGGSTFGPPINVSNTDGFSGTPQVAMYYDNVVITWREILPGDKFETFAAMSSDGGSTFGTPINVSNTDTSSQRPQIAMSGDNVVIIWVEVFPGNHQE
ncbi:MAG: sialidase family protein, partial [Nitrososphaeraceae archaeon]